MQQFNECSLYYVYSKTLMEDRKRPAVKRKQESLKKRKGLGKKIKENRKERTKEYKKNKKSLETSDLAALVDVSECSDMAINSVIPTLSRTTRSWQGHSPTRLQPTAGCTVTSLHQPQHGHELGCLNSKLHDCKITARPQPDMLAANRRVHSHVTAATTARP